MMFPERPGRSRQLNSIEEVNVPPVQAYNPNLAAWFGRRDFCRLTSPRRVTLVQERICQLRHRACLVAVF
jgi:hypothetical protein